MQQFNPDQWFDEDYNFKGVEHLPEGVDEHTMWQVLSMLPLEEAFINKHIRNLDITLLFINKQMTKNVIMNNIPLLMHFIIEDPELLQERLMDVLTVTRNSDIFNAAEEHRFVEVMFTVIKHKYLHIMSSKYPQDCAGELETLDTLSDYMATVYLATIATSETMLIDMLPDSLRTLFMAANVHFDLNTIDWSKIEKDDVDEVVEGYPVLFSPGTRSQIVNHVTEFIRLASENYNALALLDEEE